MPADGCDIDGWASDGALRVTTSHYGLPHGPERIRAMSMTQASLAKTAVGMAVCGILVAVLLILLDAPVWTLSTVAVLELLALVLGLIHQKRKTPQTGRTFYVQLGAASGILTGPLLGSLMFPGLGVGLLALWLPGGVLGAAGGWILGYCIGTRDSEVK